MTGFRNALLGAAGAATGGYSVDNSIVLDDGSSQYLSWTPSGAGTSAQQFTFSFWGKRCELDRQFIFGVDSTNPSGFSFNTDTTLRVQWSRSGLEGQLIDFAPYNRDPHAFSHWTIVWDTPNATSTDRIRAYQNGVRLSTTGTPTFPSQNDNESKINTAAAHDIGRYPGGLYSDIYLSEFVFIDGQALDPTSFGEYDTNGVWRPVDVSGLTFGTNGFYLPFTDSTNLGADGNYADTSTTSVNFDGTNDYLTRGGGLTGASDGEFLTFSCWFKLKGGNGATQRFFRSDTDIFVDVNRSTDNKIYLSCYNSSPTQLIQMASTKTYTADGQWHHLMISTKRTSGDLAAHMYIDGEDVAATPSPNIAGNIDWTRTDWGIGGTEAGGNKFNGDLAEFYLTDEYIDLSSSANREKFLTATGAPADVGSDGSTPTGTAALIYLSGATSTWHTNDGSGGGFTENGALTDGSAVRNVNANDFKTSGSPSQSSDTPTNVFSTLTPLKLDTNTTLANGNLEASASTTSVAAGSIAVNSGKWYFEQRMTGWAGGSTFLGGVMGVVDNISAGSAISAYSEGYGVYPGNGNKYNNGANSSYGTSFTNGDIIGCALDLDNGKIYWSENGVWMNSGDPAAQTNPAYTTLSGYYTIAASPDNVSTVYTNTGNTPVTGGNADGNRYGDFDYAPPSGFLAICSANLYANAAPAIEDGTAHFQATLYEGNGTSKEVNQSEMSPNSVFSPDFVWLKDRDTAYSHHLFDAVRGSTSRLKSDNSDAEATSNPTTYLSSFDADGFTVGSNVNVNTDTNNYVGWQWKGDGTSGSSNTDGSIPSTVNVNDTAGFSIVKYTSTNGSGAGTLGHGLNSTPEFIICKSRDSAYSWAVYHKNLTSAGYKLILDQTNVQVPDTTTWNNTAPDPTVFSVGTDNGTNPQGSADNMVAYCFHSVPGYSAFGSYEGNGSSDGTLVLLDLKPAFVLLKKIDTTANDWTIWDNQINPSNLGSSGGLLRPNLPNVEQSTSGQEIDVLSNGFKIRNGNNQMNTSGKTYIYAAFAEYPFAGSSPATAR